LVKIDHINVRTHPAGAMLPALVTRDHTGRIRIDVEWALLPADQEVTVFEDDVLRAGPYPVSHLPDSSSIEARLDHAKGFFSRVFIVEGGDITRFIFTCYDKDGNVMPQPGDLLEAELDGLEIYEDFSIPTIYGGGWETSLMVRSKSGTGPASLTLRMKGGKELGRWELTRRAAKDVAVSAELTTVQIKQSTLPAGVDAQTTLQIFARSELGELLGKDADVRVEAPPELRVGPALVNEAGIYESIVEPGYYGGQYEISVFLEDELLEKVPFEVIGPALPEKPASTVSWPNEEPSDVNPPVEPPPSQDPQGCNMQSGTAPSTWPLAFLLLTWIYVRTRQRDSTRRERSL